MGPDEDYDDRYPGQVRGGEPGDVVVDQTNRVETGVERAADRIKNPKEVS